MHKIDTKSIKVYLKLRISFRKISICLLLKYIDNTIRIPMRETLRSLNLSNSVAIVAYEVFKQNGFEGLEKISKYFDKRL